LPVGPANQIVISHVTDLVDLLGAGTLGQASAELSDDERHTEALGVLGSLANSFLMPLEALFSVGNLRLSRGTLFAAELAAVSMVIENVFTASDFATGWGVKTNAEDVSTEDANLVGEWNGFKPHLLIGIMRLILLEDLSVQRRQVLLVHVSWHEKHWISCRVCREWLI